MYKSVVAELQKIPEIVECHFTTGPYTMLTKLYACDNEHLMDLLNNKMQEIPGVVATENTDFSGTEYQKRNSYPRRKITEWNS